MGPSSSWKRPHDKGSPSSDPASSREPENARPAPWRGPEDHRQWNTLPELTRSSLQRHRISRLPDVDRDRPRRKKFKRSPIGCFHIDRAEATVKRFYSKTHQHFTEPLLQTWIG